MSDKTRAGDKRRTIADWKRPDGPANIWRSGIDGHERLTDGTTRPVRFSIRDIPEERYAETIEHMCKYFVADEVTCKSMKLKSDPDAMSDFRALWSYLLGKGMSVGVFKIDSNDKLLELVGANILFVVTNEVEEALGNFTVNFKSRKARKLFEFMHEMSERADVRDIYGVDTYISALGLSVDPAFRGQKLGVRLLETRDEIGRKYGLAATATVFSSPSSQIPAERAGFETALVQEYETVRDECGEPLFPGIEAKEAKIMIKRLASK